jgi:hypothetical protein
MLHAYIETRRPSAHKQAYEIFKHGTPIGGSVRTESLEHFKGNLFVPNFDLLSDAEKAQLAVFPQPWVGTAPADFDLKACGITPEFVCVDTCSDYPLQAFLCGATLSGETRQQILSLCAEDDGIPSCGDEPERMIHPLETEAPFRKLNTGFLRACGLLLQSAIYKAFPVRCNYPMMAIRLKNGKDRLYIYNPDEIVYGHAVVTCENEPQAVDIHSHYPVLPVRFLTEGNTGFAFDYTKKVAKNRFQTKVTPAGVTIVDITF